MSDDAPQPSDDGSEPVISGGGDDSINGLEQKADLLIATMGALATSHNTLAGTVGGLVEATEKNTNTIRDEAKKSRRSREFIYGIIVSVVFDIGMSIAFGALAVQAHHAADKANDSLHTQKITCEATNGSRRDSKTIWDEALSLFSDNKKPTAAQVVKGQKFRAFVDKTYAARDCSKILKPDVTVQDLLPTITPSAVPTQK